ncbi:sugar phosphate nucleotidyltransferase, partial [Rhizobium leguminosarum]|uniref:sugar phosphate nucleotidyltransferase n=1 Tax=Rhizobium leguminosarum TaxID=384 RepID=UPI003F9C05BA
CWARNNIRRSSTHPTARLRHGVGQAFIIGADFLHGDSSALVLGDNIFYGHGLPEIMKSGKSRREGATVFAYHVTDPERYGVVG